jgi:metallo-beta-lactamase class B
MKNRKPAVDFDGAPLTLVDPLAGMYWFDAPAFSITNDTHLLGSRVNFLYLITTPEGHVLIDTDFGHGSEYFTLADIINLGYNPKDIRYILLSHKHCDHVGGARRLRDITGAKVAVHEWDAEAVENGIHPEILPDGSEWEVPGCPVDMKFTRDEVIKIGGKEIEVLHTPGHSAGNLTFVWKTGFEGDTYTAAVTGICSAASLHGLLEGQKEFPRGEAPSDFLSTLDRLETMDVELFLSVHSFSNRTWEKYEAFKNGVRPHPFVDPHGWKNWIQGMRKDISKLQRGIDIWNGKGWHSEFVYPRGILEPEVKY